MNAQLWAALVRGSLIGVFAGASTALATWATTDSLKPIIIAAGTAFFGTILARLGEGGYDGRRAAKGDVRSSDVTATPTAQPVGAH